MSTFGPAEANPTFEELDDIPLFMRSLEKGDFENNAALSALQTLVYEDGPEGTA